MDTTFEFNLLKSLYRKQCEDMDLLDGVNNLHSEKLHEQFLPKGVTDDQYYKGAKYEPDEFLSKKYLYEKIANNIDSCTSADELERYIYKILSFFSPLSNLLYSRADGESDADVAQRKAALSYIKRYGKDCMDCTDNSRCPECEIDMFCGELMCDGVIYRVFGHHLDAILMERHIDLFKFQRECGIILVDKNHRKETANYLTIPALYDKYLAILSEDPMQQPKEQEHKTPHFNCTISKERLKTIFKKLQDKGYISTSSRLSDWLFAMGKSNDATNFQRLVWIKRNTINGKSEHNKDSMPINKKAFLDVLFLMGIKESEVKPNTINLLFMFEQGKPFISQNFTYNDRLKGVHSECHDDLAAIINNIKV